MARTYFEAGEQRSARVRELFAAIAPRYDLINDLQSFGLHRRWKRRVIQLARPQPGLLGLDLCCGTGDLALALARQGVRVIGLDASERMLGVAKRRVQDLNESAGTKSTSDQTRLAKADLKTPPPPHFLLGDAQRLPFADGTFDIVTVGYGLRNLASWEVGLGEMLRVARTGGRLLVLDFGKPDNWLWRSVYFTYLRFFVPVLGLACCGDASAYAYILESLRHYPAQKGVAAKMRDLGLADVRIINLLRGAMSINYARKP
jgi:demethylmenaquinone methyltransferase / 2-methoxy-6-polyprenyl-1,4-benzoquinol methylase